MSSNSDDIQERLAVCRAKVLSRLQAVLGPEAPKDCAQHLETCIYNHTIKTCAEDKIPLHWDNAAVRYRYTTKALSIEFNLKNPKNPQLLNKVCSKEVGLKKLVSASPSELFPELWEPIFERVANKQLRKQHTTDLDRVPEGAYQCARCKSKKTVYTQLQTRSADEPMTVYIQCLQCERRWKM